MLKSLPVAKPNELYRIGDKIRCCNWGGYNQGEDGDFSLFSWEMYKHFRANTPEFVDLAALQAGNAALGVRRVGSQAQADTRNGDVSALLATLIPARRAAGVEPMVACGASDQAAIWKRNLPSKELVVGKSFESGRGRRVKSMIVLVRAELSSGFAILASNCRPGI